MINEIYEFNRVVLGANPRQMTLSLDLPEQEWLLAALKEEIQEFEDSQSVAGKVDALIDLCYFAVGGLVKLGLDEDQAQDCFDAVHRANMTKKPGIKDTRPNDGSVIDAIKDENFQDPTDAIEEIING
jgi:predicted HAD superfamily Cof-like phosphohydrolase